MPPFWFRRRRRKTTSGIKPLRGSPYSNIPRWLYERNKRIKTNPLNRGESTTTKDKKINIPNLQKLLRNVVSTIKKLIKEINKIPAIERRMDAIEKQHRKHVKMLQKEIAVVDALSKQTDALLLLTKAERIHGIHGTGMKKGGKVIKRTKPIPYKRK